ncbi:hypothetical protein KXS07_11500 [Inquilinus limosus]|uniref:hypothetical protein n=1 Tax=Inquilinus limosus TaxID=171674 RepID=UPI003F18EB73
MLIASTYDRMASRSYWSKLDCLYLLAAHNSQASRLNWKADEFNISVSGSPTFTTDRGWTGALSSSLDTGFAPSSAGRNYALNSATLMGWSTTAGAAGIEANFLSVGLFANLGGSATGYLCPRDTENQIVARINDPSGILVSNTATDGMFTAVRDSATSRGVGRNDTMVGGGYVSSSITAGNLILLPGQSVVSNLTMSAAAAGAALTAAEVAQLYNDLLPYMRAVTPQDVIGSGAAQFLSEKIFEISSFDTGPINFLEPWGGSEFGHSYTFALGSGAPASVSLDPDTGLLATSGTLSPGAYTFPVVVTNLKDTSKVSTFWITIAVREGVTSNRTGYQILHKDYVVSSGTYGSPSGSDYTTVLTNIRSTIVLDQTAAGEDNFCASIVFDSNGSYDYSDNRWTFGIQRLKIRSTVPGTQATLRCITSSVFSIAVCSLQLGRGWANDTTSNSSYVGDASKDNAYFINTAISGSTTVTLKNSGDSANFVVGRWVAVASYDQQGGGFPANARYTDYAKVVSKAGANITLDRKLRWTHRDNYWESSDENSLGKARLIAIDRDDCRMTKRVHMQDIAFQLNPNSTSTSRTFFYAEALEQYFKNITVYNFCISQSRHAYLDSCLVGNSELDKLSTRFVMNGGASTLDVTDGVYAATGVELVLLRNVNSVSGYMLSPRQLRVLGGTMHGDSARPWVIGAWQTWQAWFKGVTFTRGTSGLAFREWTPFPFVTIGTEGVTYSNGVLTTPVNQGGSDLWLQVQHTAFEGCLVYVGNPASGRNGYITSIVRNSDDTAIQYAITWLNGSPPGAGESVYTSRVHEVFVDSDCVAGTNTSFNGFTFASKQTIPTITPRAFPAGYPASTYGF